MTDGIVTMFSSTLTLLGVVVILLAIDPVLALVTFATFPILAIGSIIFRIASASAYRDDAREDRRDHRLPAGVPSAASASSAPSARAATSARWSG